jgi:HAD superfamily hydrolase (TIGR01509 family)
MTGSGPTARRFTTVLLDADGTLFPSEEPAYDASARVTAAFAHRYGLLGDFTADTLRRTGVGRNFRALTADLLAEAGITTTAAELEEWIELERREVTAHLAATLKPAPDVRAVVDALAAQYRLAVVTSSATERVVTCLAATGLSDLLGRQVVFSAEDSMPTPRSKPDPAIYLHAAARLGVAVSDCVAVEDAPSGVRSAVAAGIHTVGMVCFVPVAERVARVEQLREAGAAAVIDSWWALRDVLRQEGGSSPVVAAAAPSAPRCSSEATACA